MSTDILSAQGVAALTAFARGDGLLGFDLDGTLAPLCVQRESVRVAPETASRLRALAARWPIAVLTGRRADDAVGRLGFEPDFLIGNHGADGIGHRQKAALHRRLAPARDRLSGLGDALAALGIEVEDKGLSIALHYRRAADHATARRMLDTIVPALASKVRAEPGHCVLNLIPMHSPDKGDALRAVLARCGATRACYFGDDVNDEAAFRKAPPGSIGVRIGAPDATSAAGHHLLRQARLDAVLDLLGRLRPGAALAAAHGDRSAQALS